MIGAEQRVAPVRQGWEDAGTFHGHEGFVRWVAEWNEAWGSFENQLKGVDAIGDRHAVARESE